MLKDGQTGTKGKEDFVDTGFELILRESDKHELS